MALVINKIKSFKWSVNYEYPDDDENVKVKFKAIFKRMPQKYITKMAKLATPKLDKNGRCCAQNCAWASALMEYRSDRSYSGRTYQ